MDRTVCSLGRKSGMSDTDLARANILEQKSDAELVRLLVAGNHDAMAVIFDRYYRMVMSVALRILHDIGEAEDVVQIAFTDFYRRANLFDGAKGSLRTWLLQYAYGRSINQKSSLKARYFYEQTDLEAIELERRNGNSHRVFDLDTPDAVRLVEQILPKLNEKQRFVIELAFFGGMRLSEVAAQTGESLGNIQHAYYRGIEKLRACLRETPNHASGEAASREPRFSWLRRVRKAPQRLSGEVAIAKTRTL